jgi:beta-galactosidase
VSAWGWPDLNDNWTFPGYGGKKIKVVVYSAGDAVVLKLNGTTIGEATPEKFIAVFEVVYTPGKLEAESRSENKRIGTAELRTHGTPASIHASVEENYGDATRVIDVEIRDAEGCRAVNAAEKVSVEIEGAELLGFGSGDPASEHNYSTPADVPFNGRLLAVIRMTSKTARLTFRSLGLPDAIREVR